MEYGAGLTRKRKHSLEPGWGQGALETRVGEAARSWRGPPAPRPLPSSLRGGTGPKPEGRPASRSRGTGGKVCPQGDETPSLEAGSPSRPHSCPPGCHHPPEVLGATSHLAKAGQVPHSCTSARAPGSVLTAGGKRGLLPATNLCFGFVYVVFAGRESVF